MVLSKKNIFVKLIRSTFAYHSMIDMPVSVPGFFVHLLVSIIVFPFSIWSHLMNAIGREYGGSSFVGIMFLIFPSLIGFCFNILPVNFNPNFDDLPYFVLELLMWMYPASLIGIACILIAVLFSKLLDLLINLAKKIKLGSKIIKFASKLKNLSKEQITYK